MTDVSSSSVLYTPAIITSQLVSNIRNDQAAQAALEQEVSTGNQINQPSDNPAGAASIMQLQSAVTRAQQYVTNANDGLGWLGTANSTLNQVVGLLQQVRQTVVSAGSASLSGSQSGLAAMAQQVRGTLQSLLDLANTQYGGQAVFAGTGNVGTAYDPSGNYVGGGSAPTRTVSIGTQVSVSVTGPQVFGTGSSGLLGNSSGNVGVLAQIANDLQSGTPASLQQLGTTDLASLDSALNQVESQAAVVGANYQQMQTFSQEATNTQTALQTEISNLQSADMPQVLSELTQSQNSYQAALWATAQVGKNSLVQFLG